MAGEGKGGGRGGAPHEAQRLSTSRLFVIVAVFLVLAVYAIWNSDRFQSLFQGVSQGRLSEALQRPVSFHRVEFHVFPPSVRLADGRVGNDPRIPSEPLFSAEEISVGGGISVTGGEIRLGRVRAIHPRLSLVQFPDGSWNLPPGLAKPATPGGGGLQLRVAELVVQQGTLLLDGREKGIDGRLEGFAAELFSLPRGRYRGTVACRKATLGLRHAEPLVFGLDVRFRLDTSRGLNVEALRVVGEFGDLRAAATIDDLKNPTLLASISGEVHTGEVERVFHSSLGFIADTRVQARLRIPPSGGFRITGKLSTPRLDAKGFPVENLEASVVVRPDALVAHIEKAVYAGGEVSGVYRIENVGRPGPRPMTLALEGKGLSIERFFGDIRLPGTGLSGAATLSVALRWGEGGLERANGGATLAIAPGPAASIVRGRFGIPLGGGGPLTIVDGRIGFHSTALHLASSDIEVTGGLRIGQWNPDFDVRIRSRDLAELDRVFQNFVAATGDRPSPLGFGGTGEIEGHIAKSWGDPDASLQVSAENARYSGVLFGSVRGAVDMHDGAFLFHPLRVYEGSAAVSLEGTVRYRRDPERPRLDLTATAKEYPVERFLEYLDLDYPITGRVTGTFPLAGNPPDGVTGGGAVALEDAVLWGQAVSRIAGRLLIEPRVLRFEDVRANLGPGMLGGHAVLAYRERTFALRLAGDGIRLGDLDVAREASPKIAGRLSFELEGSGSFDRPDFQASASLSDGSFYGHTIPAALEPRLTMKVVRGELDGSIGVAGHWSIAARGDVAVEPARLDVTVDAPDLPALLLLTPGELVSGDQASITAHGSVTIPLRGGETPVGEFAVTATRLEARGHRAAVRTDGDVKVSFRGARIAISGIHLLGDGIDLRADGVIDASAGKGTVEGRLSGTTDASIVELVVPDAGLEGKIVLDVVATGSYEDPQLAGSIRIEDGRYRMAGFSLENIDGAVRLTGSRGDIEALRARVGDGEALAAGSFRLEALRLQDFRVSIQGRHIALRTIPAMRLTVDADLVVTGNDAGNQVRGEITLLRGTYSKDVEVTISDLLERSRPTAITLREAWKERTTLDVRIVSAASLEVRNNLARLSGNVDLTARGTLAEPVLLGQIQLDEGGRFIFSDVRYEIESGTITFANTTRVAPFIDLRARAEIKGYNLVVLLAGAWPRISATFTSDPPLSNDAILALVLTGTPPDTREEIDTSSQLVSAAGGALAGAVTGGLQKKTRQLFGLDRFQIEPVFTSGQLTTVRSTIGKRITQDLTVTSSIALDSSKEPIIRVEWQATNDILVLLTRDENGILAISFRRRQRL
jgi:hypothetical protein